MKNDALKYSLLGLLIGGALVWVGTTTVINSNNYPMMSMMGLRNINSYNTKLKSDSIDAHFIEQMIPHHEDAITMSKIALIKSQNENVKNLASAIISAQNKEIEQMKSWYKDWFGRELPTGSETMKIHGMGMGSGMHMGMMGDQTDLLSLENAQDFDREFLEQMIPHHQMAVMMAQMLKNGTDRPEMKNLADNIIISQTSEIEQMRKWLLEWSN